MIKWLNGSGNWSYNVSFRYFQNIGLQGSTHFNHHMTICLLFTHIYRTSVREVVTASHLLIRFFSKSYLMLEHLSLCLGSP